MEVYTFSIFITIFISLFTFYLAFNVGLTRQKNKSMAWEDTTNKDVMIANRVHMNTIEASAVYLPLLWVATVFGPTTLVGIFGSIWCISRVWYAFAYLKNPKKRQIPFMIGIVMMLLTAISGLYGIFV